MALLPIADKGWRRPAEFQRAVRVDCGTPVDQFHVGDGLLHEAVELRQRPAGVDEIVAAASRLWAGLIFGAFARHEFHQKSRGQFSVAILILLSTA